MTMTLATNTTNTNVYDIKRTSKHIFVRVLRQLTITLYQFQLIQTDSEDELISDVFVVW